MPLVRYCAESMKPNKCKRHFETTHKEYMGKPKSCFERKRDELSRQRMHFRKVPFASTYLCEAGLSALVCMKSKYCSRLDVTDEMRCALSTTAPDFDKLQRDHLNRHAKDL
ncbi:hypothetical protein ANANG_G00011920, partial [Anguilla anguilla]